MSRTLFKTRSCHSVSMADNRECQQLACEVLERTAVQPFSPNSRTATVPEGFETGLCGVVEPDLELCCNSCSAVLLGERLYVYLLDGPSSPPPAVSSEKTSPCRPRTYRRKLYCFEEESPTVPMARRCLVDECRLRLHNADGGGGGATGTTEH